MRGMQNDKVPRWFHKFTGRFSDHVRDNEKAHGELNEHMEKFVDELTFRIVVIVGAFTGLSTALILGVLPLLID